MVQKSTAFTPSDRARRVRRDRRAERGGLRVRQLPAYVSVPAKSTVNTPLRCAFEAPAGTYILSLATYEAPLGDAPAERGTFDCTVSVDRYNAGHEKTAHVSIGGDVREVQSAAVVARVP
jgi:hypothetical protein